MPSYPDDDLLRLDLYNSDDLLELDNVFNEFQAALSLQKAKLTGKWISQYTKRDPILTPNDKSNDSTNDSNTNKNGDSSDASIAKKELLIDKKSVLKHISSIGTVKGRKFEELEQEQNKAIRKLEDILKFEENARVSRDKAVRIQEETELEVKEIDAQRAIIANELAKAEPQLRNARKAVSSISDAALNELVSLKKPPSTVSNVLTVAVWIIAAKVEAVSKSNRSNQKAPKSTTGASANRKFFDSSSLSSPNTPGSSKSPNHKDKSSGQRKGNQNRPKSTRNGKGARERSKSRAREKKRHFKTALVCLCLFVFYLFCYFYLLIYIFYLVFLLVFFFIFRGDTRKMINSLDFKKQVMQFDPKTLAKHVCSKIESDFLVLEDFDIARANKASKVLGPLVQWIVSLVGYGKIWFTIRPMALKVSELEQALEQKQTEVKELQQTSETMHQKVKEIRSEMLIMIGYKKIGELYFMS